MMLLVEGCEEGSLRQRGSLDCPGQWKHIAAQGEEVFEPLLLVAG